jgi:cytochrome c556
MRRLTLTLGMVATLTAAAVATAAVKPETAIRYRQSAYTMLGWNFGPMAQMVRGKTAWDAADFARRAERVAFLAPQLLEGFPEGSDTGAMTEAKPEIWKDMNDFKSKMDDLVKQSKLLAEVAKSGDEEKMKEQFKNTASTCKACHEKYRNED